MSDVLNKLRKLRGRGPTELRARGAQALHAYAERRGWSQQSRVPEDAALFGMLDAPQGQAKFTDAASLLEHFRRRTSPKFFASFDDPAATRAELQRRFGGEAKRRVVEQAEKICAGRFDLLGLRDLSFGEPVDWHLEPVSNRRAPLAHWSRISYLDASVAGDKKITWELNRQQYLLTLGRAYRHTGDERYAQTFAAHLDAWMQGNPPKLGINWASSLEVAFRSIAWLWSLHFFKDSAHLTPPVFSLALKFLYLHARHLETYLSTYFSPNTHLTGEALGLYYIGTLLPEFRQSVRWRETGKRILLAQLERHIKPDGVYFEQSSYYQRYTTDFYTHFYLLAQANDDTLDASLADKLQASLDHLMHLTRPDGTTPFYGDDDGGRLVSLDERPVNDFRSTLINGAALFGRGDYKYVAGDVSEETLWLVGVKGLRALDKLASHPPAQTSRAFPDGGYYCMRDGWTRDDNYLLIDCGPHGADNCGHAHADALSIELAARGRTLLVDAGTYTYTGSAEMRDAFRSSAAHNTLVIDGQSSSVPDTAFTWKQIARATARRWTSHARFDLFKGEHDGYTRLDAPAVHARSILFIKGGYWILRDEVETRGAHEYEMRFHFEAGARPSVSTDGDVAAARERGTTIAPGLELLCFGKGVRARAEEGWISHSYGSREAAPVVAFTARGEGPQEFITFLIPQETPATPATGVSCVRALEASGGRAFAVEVAAITSDRVLVGDGRRLIETARIASDFAWTWARLSGDERTLEELVLIDGSNFRFDDCELVGATARAGYVVARRAGDVWLVETDAGDGLDFASPFARARVVVNGEEVESSPPFKQDERREACEAQEVGG